MSGLGDSNIEKKKEILKEIFSKAKETKDPTILKKKLKEFFSKVDPIEISFVEQDLLREGLSWREIYRMCDVHFELVKDMIIPRGELRDLPDGHPLKILLWENTEILKDNEKMNILFRIADREPEVLEDILTYLNKLYVGLKKHYMKNQFLIFPYLEKRGVTAVSRVLWMKEDMLLNSIKKLRSKISNIKKKAEKPSKEIISEGYDIISEVRDIVARENNILYPTMISLLSDGEWLAILNEMDKFGYYSEPVPKGEWKPLEDVEPLYPYMLNPDDLKKVPSDKNIPPETFRMLKMATVDDHILVRNDDIELENGYLNKKELNALLNSLPFEITFIDLNGRTRYFNEPKEAQIFLRTKTILGRPVKLCHPPKSEELVHQVAEKLKNGQDSVDFWIDFMGRKVYIKFIGVRDNHGDLLGILEVVQDITELKKIEGEKRTLY